MCRCSAGKDPLTIQTKELNSASFGFFNILCEKSPLKDLLEIVMTINETKKWHCIGHHPYVTTAAIIVWLGPCPVIISNGENHVCLSSGVCCGIVSVGVETCK